MNSSPSFTVESEKIIAGLEKKLNYKEKSPLEPGRVVWTCNDLCDLLPLLASLSHEPKSLVFDNPPNGNLLDIPLFLRYSDTIFIELYTDEPSKTQTLNLFESLNIDSHSILKTITERGIRFASGKEPPFALKGENEAINLIMKLLIDKPDDMRRMVTSIHAEGPFANLKDFELMINTKLDRSATDIVWLPVSHERVSDLKKNSENPGPITNDSEIIPLMILNSESLSRFDNETKAADYLKDLRNNFEHSIKNVSKGRIFPPLILSRTWYLDDFEKTSYERDCFALLWKTLEISRFNDSMNRRLNSLADFVLKKPADIIGLLHQKANLERLRSFPDMKLNYPDFRDFTNLCKKGIEKYSREFIHISEPKKISPAEKVFGVFIKAAHGFLSELALKDLYREEHKEFSELARVLERDGSKWDQEKFEKFAAEIDSLLNRIGNRLEDKKNNLQSELKNKKAYLDSVTGPDTKYTAEEIENLTFFWKDFIPLILKKIKNIKPYDEIKKTCEKTKTDFLKKISLTAHDYIEIDQDMKMYWVDYSKKITEQFDHSSLIWELKIIDELNKIEEFRENNFPEEMKITASFKVNISPMPVINQVLKLQIAKPGLINMLVSQQKKEKWHSETMRKISNYIGDIIKQYLKDVMDWILMVEINIDKKFAEIEKIGDDSLHSIKKIQENNKKIIQNISMTKKDIETLEQKLDTFDDIFKSHQGAVKQWIEIKS